MFIVNTKTRNLTLHVSLDLQLSRFMLSGPPCLKQFVRRAKQRQRCARPHGLTLDDSKNKISSEDCKTTVAMLQCCKSIIYGIILPIDFHMFEDGYCTTKCCKMLQTCLQCIASALKIAGCGHWIGHLNGAVFWGGITHDPFFFRGIRT